MTTGIELDICEQIAAAAKRLYRLGLINIYEGNISVRHGPTLFITPSQQDKEALTADQIVHLTFQGDYVEQTQYKASSEWKMHRALYELRPDISAIIHNHSPYATAFATAGMPISADDIPEAALLLGTIPVCKYGRPSTDAIYADFSKYFCEDKKDVVLLANHGVVCAGQNMQSAFSRSQEVEKIAKIRFILHQLGGASPLPVEEGACFETYRQTMWDQARQSRK